MANTAHVQSPNSNQTGEEDSLYAKHQKIYPRAVHGIFAFWRTVGVFVLLGLYYIVPWLQYRGRQAVLLDLPARKFYVFGITFWPQDFFFLAVLLMIAALSLFFFTAFAGRLWCGFACPQTVWTEVFLWIERRIEGDRPKQIRRDKAPMTAQKFLVKSAKHGAWILFAAFTGFTFVGYFSPIHDLWHRILTLDLGHWETFWIIFYSVATYGNAGWLREQVCIYMCPYARFQSAMFDKDTLIISYDAERGEPRGQRKKSIDHHAAGLGDCIDCTLCVQVCPTGIDIRNGLQYQCIACASCIDVCDQVMDQVGYPRGLVRYTTENAMEGKMSHIIRPRMIVYALILLAMAAGLVVGMLHRTPLQLDVIRDRNTLYRETYDGQIVNVYTLQVLNMDERPHDYHLSATGIPGLKLEMDQKDKIEVHTGEVKNIVVRLKAKADNLKRRSTDVTFTLQADDNPSIKTTKQGAFLGPIPGSE